MSVEKHDIGVPPVKSLRDAIRLRVRDYCRRQKFVPPLLLEELEEHANFILEHSDISPEFKNFILVLIGNEIWGSTMARIPYERRILLLPQCLRASKGCRAETDALGLLCSDCGLCPIGTLQREAEKLGYAVLVAEGAASVAALLERGDVEAVVGVSCLSVLEKSFHPLAIRAIPSMAVPLLRNGCLDTMVDMDWVVEILRLRSDEPLGWQPDLNALRREVVAWFEPVLLRDLIGPADSTTAEIAAAWVAKGGKRWRPLLAAAVFRALRPGEALPDALRRAAVAVECFHKASLIHDDIEDGDATRYGDQTMHCRHGLDVALNVGDLLIGEGYGLIARSGATDRQVREMIAVAAEAHRILCLGQGEELLLRRKPQQISVESLIPMFRKKTAPAFDVAMQMGAILAEADSATRAALSGFSSAIGVAYQIADDLEDVSPSSALAQAQPSILTTLASDRSGLNGLPVAERARELVKRYEKEALRALKPLRQPALKSLLYRVAALILHHSVPS